jgi:hypothetical protein
LLIEPVEVGHFDDRGLADGLALELAHALPFAQDHDPLGDERQFLDVGRNHDDADALLRQPPQGIVDFLARADVDPARGLVENEKPGLAIEPARNERLLLISPPARRRARRETR